MDLVGRLEDARRLHDAEQWDEACDAFVAVDEVEALGVRDLELLAESAQVMGRGELAVATLQRAYETRAGSGDVDRAITVGFWLWQALVINGEFSRAGGWASVMPRSSPTAPTGTTPNRPRPTRRAGTRDGCSSPRPMR